jgi:hypothetical protein
MMSCVRRERQTKNLAADHIWRHLACFFLMGDDHELQLTPIHSEPTCLMSLILPFCKYFLWYRVTATCREASRKHQG